eukprot:9109863-Heterocapsa_arctica.AAC.1
MATQVAPDSSGYPSVAAGEGQPGPLPRPTVGSWAEQQLLQREAEAAGILCRHPFGPAYDAGRSHPPPQPAQPRTVSGRPHHNGGDPDL